MVIETNWERVVKKYRIDKMSMRNIAKELGLSESGIRYGIREFERENRLKSRKLAQVGDIVEFHKNGGTASGEVVKLYNNSVLVEIIDMEFEDVELSGKTVVNNSKYRVVHKDLVAALAE